MNILLFEAQKTVLFPSVSLSSLLTMFSLLLNQLSGGYLMLLKQHLTEENESACYPTLRVDLSQF